MRFELPDEDFASLMLMLGYATGAAYGKGDRELEILFIQLTLTIFKKNPNYGPSLPDPKESTP